MPMSTQNLIAAILLVVFCAGCADRHRDAPEVEVTSDPQADVYIEKTDGALDDFDRGLNDLERRLSAAGDSVRAQAEDQLVSLRTQRDKLRQDLERLEGAAPATIERQRRVLDDRLDQMQKELDLAALEAIQQRDEFERALGDRMAEADSLLSALELNRQPVDSTSGSKYRKVLSDLEEEQAAVADSIDELRQASADTFRMMRTAVARTVVGLHHRVRQAMAPVGTTADSGAAGGSGE